MREMIVLCINSRHASAVCSLWHDISANEQQPTLPLFAGGRWNLFKGQPGKAYRLYSDGSGATLDATFGAGGLKGKATFVRALAFAHGKDRVTAVLQKQKNGNWLLAGVQNMRLYVVHAFIHPVLFSADTSIAPS
jgi:hypothetical protein